jgi:hypothetical protein
MCRKTLICLAIMGILLLVCSGWRIHMRGPPREEEAKRLRDQLTSLHDLDHLPEGVDLFRFPDDTWVMGAGIDSHSMRQAGGTLALRDSRGKVQVFVGHVCGPGVWATKLPFNKPRPWMSFTKPWRRCDLKSTGVPRIWNKAAPPDRYSRR